MLLEQCTRARILRKWDKELSVLQILDGHIVGISSKPSKQRNRNIQTNASSLIGHQTLYTPLES